MRGILRGGEVLGRVSRLGSLAAIAAFLLVGPGVAQADEAVDVHMSTVTPQAANNNATPTFGANPGWVVGKQAPVLGVLNAGNLLETVNFATVPPTAPSQAVVNPNLCVGASQAN